jgi:hypothetical protein
MDHAMMARMDSIDVALDSLSKVMNGATGTRKVNAMAAMLNVIVGHHREMHRMMHRSDQRMLGMAGGHDGGRCDTMQRADSDSAAAPTGHQHH